MYALHFFETRCWLTDRPMVLQGLNWNTKKMGRLPVEDLELRNKENKQHKWSFTCIASWLIVQRSLPWEQLSASWYSQVFIWWDFFFFPFPFLIWRPVPKQYLVNPCASGWIKGLGLFIASLLGILSLNFRGMTAGQSIPFLGSFLSSGISKQPWNSPNANWLKVGYLQKLCLKYGKICSLK